MKTLEERNASQREARKRWLSKPGSQERQGACTKRWREKNRKKYLASMKRYREEPLVKESHRKEQLQYASNHREQEKSRAVKWRKENPKIANFYTRNYAAQKRAGSGKVTRKFILNLFVVQGGICLTCKADFAETGYQIDHIVPLSKGGEHANWNVQLLCPTCNKRKSARTMEEFMRILEVQNA